MSDEYEEEEYSTDDLALATYLVYQDHELRRMEWREPRDCYFVFHISDALMNDIVDYTGGLASADPKKYMSEYSKIKRKMHTERPREMDPRRSQRTA